MLTNTLETSHHQIEMILTYFLIVVAILKISTRIFLIILYRKTKDPFFIKNQQQEINYSSLTNSYFEYFKIRPPKMNPYYFSNKKFSHCDIKNHQISPITIPDTIDDRYLNGFNLDFILVHFWLFKQHLKRPIKIAIQKFLTYTAYDLVSWTFYILIFIRIFFLVAFSKNSGFDTSPFMNFINETHILTLTLFGLLVLSWIFLISGIFIKKHWEKQSEKENLRFVNEYFPKYLNEYNEARNFSKKHRFALYFKARTPNGNQFSQTIKTEDKYLGPFVVIKTRRYNRNR